MYVETLVETDNIENCKDCRPWPMIFPLRKFECVLESSWDSNWCPKLISACDLTCEACSDIS